MKIDRAFLGKDMGASCGTVDMQISAATQGTAIGPTRSLKVLIDVRLTAARFAARDTNLYELQRLDGDALPAAEPGAHIDLHLPNGLVRQYSLIATDCAPSTYLIGVKHDPKGRGGSGYIHQQLRVGALLQISVPRNHFPLIETRERVVLIAGGIGITPIWSMAKRLQAFDRPWELHYSVRSRADALFSDEMSSLPSARLYVNDENNGRILDLPGLLDTVPRGAHIYCCGPATMLAAFENATKYRPKEQIHVEHFSAQCDAATDGGFVVELARSARQVKVPAGMTVLQALRNCGVDVPWSCEQGVCGACETGVISGIPDHKDVVLTDHEHNANDRMMICCSGCKSDRLILDL